MCWPHEVQKSKCALTRRAANMNQPIENRPTFNICNFKFSTYCITCTKNWSTQQQSKPRCNQPTNLVQVHVIPYGRNMCYSKFHILVTLDLNSSGGARTSRQSGHFQFTKVVRQVMHFFPQTSFLVVAIITQTANAADCFTVKMKHSFTFTFAICRRPSVCRLSVCLLSVTFVRPTQMNEILFLRHLVHWSSVDIQVKFHGDHPMGITPSGELHTIAILDLSEAISRKRREIGGDLGWLGTAQ